MFQTEEDEKRRRLARQRFRMCVRSVVYNSLLLMESGDQKISLNVKKNIAMLIRPQRQIGMITLSEKALIRRPHHKRSIEERRALTIFIAGLGCFSRMPPKIRARLGRVIDIIVLNPNRKIVQEGGKPMTVYFIVSGEVEVSKKIYDYLSKQYVEHVQFIYGPGDSIGDIEFIENTTRKYTYTSRTEVELLVLYEDDFNKILREYMTKEWIGKNESISQLKYFNFFTEEQINSACSLGVLRQFEPLETIYHEDKGHASYVHFIISGECVILQCLKMKVRTKNGIKSFELAEVSKSDAGKLFGEDNVKRQIISNDLERSRAIFDIEKELFSEDDIPNQTTNKILPRGDLRNIEISCGSYKRSRDVIIHRKSKASFESKSSNFVEVDNYSEFEDENKEEYSNVEEMYEDEITDDSSEMRLLNEEEEPYLNNEFVSKTDIISLKTVKSQVVKEDKSHIIGMRKPIKKPAQKTSVKIENRFIDVGSLFFGGIFGLGEKLEHRVIMARTTVQCFMLPRFWLLEEAQNPGNIWQRRRFYLDSTVPSRQSLFQNFLTTRKWHKYRNELVESYLDSSSTANPTKVEDIPIICRIVESAED